MDKQRRRLTFPTIILAAMMIMASAWAVLPGLSALAAEPDPASIDSYAPEGGQNLAVGAAVTSSSSYEKANEGWCNAHLADGVLATAGTANGWTTNPADQVTDPTVPAWARLDLGEAKAISRIVIFPRSDSTYGLNYPVDYTVELSQDGETYQTVKSVTGAPVPTAPEVIDLAEPAQARYVKLNVTRRYGEDSEGGGLGNDGKLVQLSEIAVFSAPAPDPDPQPELTDIDSYAPEGMINLALRATLVEASSSYQRSDEGWNMDFIKDGVLGYPGCAVSYPKGWTTNPHDAESSAEEPAWIRLTLPDTYSIKRFVLFPRSDGNVYGDCFPMAYELRVSTDGTHYTKVAQRAETGLPTAPVVVDLDEAVDAKYVELYVSLRYDQDAAGAGAGNDGKLVQISELAVFGEESEDGYDPTNIDSYAPAGTTNLAPASDATASSTYEPTDSFWSLSCINNGVLQNDGWTTNPFEKIKVPTTVAWVAMDTKAIHEMKRVVVFPQGQSSFPADFTIQVSDNGTDYTDVHTSTGNPMSPAAPLVINLPENTQGRYMRLYVTKRNGSASGDGYMVQLAEIALFGVVSQVSININKPALLLEPGDTEPLQAEIIKNPDDTVDLEWSSSNPQVATVDEQGQVQAVAAGETTITLKDALRDVETTCAVTVVNQKEWVTDDFLISVFWPPTLDYVNDEQYQAMAEAGINLVNNVTGNDLNEKETNLKMAALAYKYNMQVSVADNRFGGNLTGLSNDEIKALVQEYTNVPGVGGFYILDEPYNPNPYARIFNAMKEAAPEYYPHLNFLPNVYGSWAAYRQQMSDWASLTGARDYLMYDRYPFGWQANSLNYSDMLNHLETVRQVGLDYGVKTAMYLQSIGVIGNFRRTNIAEIRYEANIAMAYGLKQLSYFCWWTPTNRSEQFTDAIIDPEGNKTDLYEPVKALNAEIHALGTTLMKLDAKEVYFNGETWGQQAVPEDFFVKALTDDNLTFSYMRDKTTGRNYLMVVNNSFTNEITTTLEFAPEIASLEEISRESGRAVATTLNQHQLQLMLPKGEGYLFALPEAYDYENPDQQPTPINENLALNKAVTATSSLGENGWFGGNVTDGFRFSGNGKNGWSSTVLSAVSPVDLTVDLGKVRSVNRIDLYPAGQGYTYGEYFPKSFELQVSEDGTTWQTVVTQEDFDAPTTGGIAFSFGTRQARYVRLHITDMHASGQSFARAAAQTGSYQARLAELEVYNDDNGTPDPEKKQTKALDPYVEGQNIAKGKEVTVSSTTPDGTYEQWGWASKFLVDENLDNGWTSNINLHTTTDAQEWAVVDFGAPHAVNLVEVYAIGTFVVDYQVELSADGKAWTPILTQTGDSYQDGGEKLRAIPLADPVTARYVRIISTKLKLSGPDGALMQVAEIKAFGTPVCDKTALRQTVEQAQGLDAEDYTPDSWTDMEQALQQGRTILNAQYSYQYQADNALELLTGARSRLRARADFGVLRAAVDQAEAITDTSGYRPSTVERFARALTAARGVLSDLNATQTQVDDAMRELNEAMAELGLKADKTKLQQSIGKAGTLEQENYTSESFAALTQALTAARGVLTDPEALQDQTDTAQQALEDAMAALELLPADKQTLQKAVAEAKKLDEKLYTPQSWEQLRRALENGQLLLDNDALTVLDQQTVDQAAAAVEAARKALVQAASITTPTAATPVSTTGDQAAHGGTVATGDATPLVIFIVLAVVSALGIAGAAVWLLRRKKDPKA